MMHPLILMPLILLYLCLLVFLAGLNWHLPGYSRRKILEGMSGRGQMRRRYRQGADMMRISGIVAAIIAGLFFLVTTFWIDRYEYEIPNAVSVTMVRDQGVVLLLIDGVVYKRRSVDMILDGFKLDPNGSYPRECISLERNINAFGWDMTWLEAKPDLIIDTSPRCINAYDIEHLGGTLE